ncbi:MAG: hypothetical protein B7Y37_01650 [Sphingobacteriia bacterium 28-36-52]|nr:MAG: hypothetical protein B7Y37_01650 [Sphingobacteriia bacterium 28-36-52]
MKNIVWLSVTLLLGCRYINQSDSRKVNIYKFYDGWDSTTKQVLKKYSTSNNGYAGKANFILKSLNDEVLSGIEILDRNSFFKAMQNNLIKKDEEYTSIIIVELNQTGEKNSFRKYVIFNSDSCMIFEKDIKGEWGIINRNIVSLESASYLQSVETDTIANNSWGGGINDICIITKVIHDSTVVTPLLYLHMEKYSRLLKTLSH